MSRRFSFKLPEILSGATREERHSINAIIDGRLDSFGEVTATLATTVTTVTASAIQADSVVTLVPMNAAAHTEYLAGNGYVSAVRDGEFDITHASASTTRTYRYAWIG